jgi:hypothetical protein
MTHVMSQSQLSLARNAKDWDRFAASARRRYEQQCDFYEAPKVIECDYWDDSGHRFKVVRHRLTGEVLGIL